MNFSLDFFLQFLLFAALASLCHCCCCSLLCCWLFFFFSALSWMLCVPFLWLPISKFLFLQIQLMYRFYWQTVSVFQNTIHKHSLNWPKFVCLFFFFSIPILKNQIWKINKTRVLENCNFFFSCSCMYYFDCRFRMCNFNIKFIYLFTLHLYLNIKWWKLIIYFARFSLLLWLLLLIAIVYSVIFCIHKSYSLFFLLYLLLASSSSSFFPLIFLYYFKLYCFFFFVRTILKK